MSDKSEDAVVRKEKGDSKAVSSKAEDRYKHKRKHEKRSSYERKDETSSSNNYSSHKTNHIPLKRNIAQNRLTKLRTKLDAEIKLREKVESVGISRLLDDSVVRVEKSRSLPNKHKLPKIPKVAPRVTSSPVRNVAAERLKKVKKEVQAAIETVQSSHSTEDKDLLMEIDEDIAETSNENFSNTIDTFKNTKEISFSNGVKNYVSHSDVFSFEVNFPQNTEEIFVERNINATNNNESAFDIVPFINDEISKIREEPSYMASHTNFVSDTEMEVDRPVGDLLIVIDTNVFLSHLNIVNYLLKNPSLPSLNSCVLVVPWPVIQEIDYAMKKNNERLNCQARCANNFINDCLKKKHPRFFGQSLVDFKENFKNAVNIDDFILQYCLKFVSFNKKVILLTNDKNLSSKAMINHLSVFTTNEFVNHFDLSEFF